MELVTKEYLEDNIKTYDTYRGLDKIGSANGIATLDANGKVPVAQIPSGIANDVTYNNNLVTSLVAGTNTSMSISNGALTINSTAATSTDITNAINALDVSDSAVSGKYVSAVSETNGKITVTRANFPAGSLPSYTTSDKGKVLKVNSAGDAVEWGDAVAKWNQTTRSDKITFTKTDTGCTFTFPSVITFATVTMANSANNSVTHFLNNNTVTFSNSDSVLPNNATTLYATIKMTDDTHVYNVIAKCTYKSAVGLWSIKIIE